MMRKFCNLDKYCEGVIVVVASLFFSEEKTCESLTEIKTMIIRMISFWLRTQKCFLLRKRSTRCI